ncbi:MAG: hypothetical protein AABY22_03190 [Nanoarchaeota archaeon]
MKKLTKKQSKALKECYHQILDMADEIDKILDGSIFKDSIYELVEKQAIEFGLTL